MTQYCNSIVTIKGVLCQMIRKVAVIDDNDGDVADSDAPVIDYSILQHTNAQS